MGKNTKISWCRHTFNMVWGCVPVSPGCDNCYAAFLDKRTGGNYWDGKTPPRVTGDQNWRKPVRWNKDAIHESERPRVFCGSMCDVFDNRIPLDVRERLWTLINSTQNLDWLLLTKRAPNIKRFLPLDWKTGYNNVWLGVTVEDRKYGLPRIDVIRDIPAKVRFLSIEPLLEDLGPLDLTGIHWVIVGGESGPGARKMEAYWAEKIRRQCIQQNVSFFFKQMGGTAADKGGDLLNGVEYKSIPAAFFPMKIPCVEV